MNPIERFTATLRPILAAAFALALATGCDIQFSRREMSLRPNDDGSLDVLLVYRGISAAKETEASLKGSLEIAHRFLEGRRELAAPFWPGHVDLDAPDACQGLDEETARILQAITLEESGIFLDPEGRLSAYQKIHLPDLAGAIDAWNRTLTGAVLGEIEDGTLKSYDEFDERSRQLWIERARSGKPWISFTDGLLVVDLPLTRATTDHLQRLLIDETAKSARDSGALAGLLSQLRCLSIEAERVTLAFGAPETGIFQIVEESDGEYRPALLEALEAEGIHPEPAQPPSLQPR